MNRSFEIRRSSFVCVLYVASNNVDVVNWLSLHEVT